MTLLPRSLLWRVVSVLLLAAIAVSLLDRVVSIRDAKAAQRDQVTVPREEPAPPVRLTAVDGTILLATGWSAIAMDAAPVVQVLADGGFAVRRPPPLPAGPGQEPHRASPVVLLPTSRFDHLDARARATLVEVLSALIAERPVSVDRFCTADFRLAAADLQQLLAWVR